MIRYFLMTDWQAILAEATKSNILWRSSCTYWWKIGEPAFLNERTGKPCGPAGEWLYCFDNSRIFVENAAKRPGFYGTNGLTALEAAYHGNVTIDGHETGFSVWEDYNRLIDKFHSSLDCAVELIRSHHA